MLFKQVTLCLVSLMKGFCPEMDCLEGIMYGGGFVQGGFVRKWRMSRGSYVWRGFCPRGFCPRTVCVHCVLLARLHVCDEYLLCMRGCVHTCVRATRCRALMHARARAFNYVMITCANHDVFGKQHNIIASEHSGNRKF